MNIYLSIIIFFLVAHYLLDLIAGILNVKHAINLVPSEFEGVYDDNEYRRAQDYLKTNTSFSLTVKSIMLPITIVFIMLGGFNVVDSISRNAGCGPIVTGLLFSSLLYALSFIINLPFSIYDTFVIEERFGFNKTDAKTFVTDRIKSLFLSALLGLPLLAAVLWFFENAGPRAWVYCWLALTAFQATIYFLAPVLIMPLFNKFTPLEDGPVLEAIRKYAKAQKFRMRGVFKMDGSKRSTKSNAFFTGFGRFRRIVLFDTLLEHSDTDEIIAVLAHEMGHYKKKHLIKHLIMSTLTNGLMFYILSLFINNPGVFEAFGMDNLSIYASLIFFAFLYTPIETLLGITANIISRKHEFEADEYAVKSFPNPDAMINLLKKLSVKNLSNLTPHPFKVFISYSHPPVLERIKAIRSVTVTTEQQSI